MKTLAMLALLPLALAPRLAAAEAGARAAADTTVEVEATHVPVAVAALEQPEPVERPGAPVPAPAPAAVRSRHLGLDAIAIVPVGDYADVADLAAGAALRLEIPLGRGHLTGRIGALFHQTRVDASLTLVPVYAGYRHPLTATAYIAGELGITYAQATVDTPFGRVSDSDSELGLALMAGVRRGALDLRAGLFSPDADDALGLMASAGYDFAAF